MAFSSDGKFFVCGARPWIWLWEESSTDSLLHLKGVSSSTGPFIIPHPSPNGQSIVIFNGYALFLWLTIDLPTSPCDLSQAHQNFGCHILEFSPDGSLAAATQRADKLVTILYLKSGIPQLTIDTGVKVHGVRVAETTIFVVGDEKIITWNLPGVGVLNARANIDDSFQTTALDYPIANHPGWYEASISPDLNYIAIVNMVGLNIYNVSTGKYLTGAAGQIEGDEQLWFTPDGGEVWCGFTGSCGYEWKRWSVIKDSESNIPKLEDLDTTEGPPGGSCWKSPDGYQVMSDGWLLNSSGKQLSWIPPHWYYPHGDHIWNGQFLAFLNVNLPKPIILELLE